MYVHSRQQYLARVREEYRRASKSAKTRLLNEARKRTRLNRSVIRKLIRYGPIPARHAEAFQKFYTAHLNRYLNFHRPCGFVTILPGAAG